MRGIKLNVPGVCFRRGMMKELVALQESLCHCPNCSEESSVVSLREGSGVFEEEVGKKLEALFQPYCIGGGAFTKMALYGTLRHVSRNPCGESRESGE